MKRHRARKCFHTMISVRLLFLYMYMRFLKAVNACLRKDYPFRRVLKSLKSSFLTSNARRLP